MSQPVPVPPETPQVRRVPHAAELISRDNRGAGRRFAVLDDDPTGSQAVHGVSVVTVPSRREYARGLAEPGDTCFVLTNSRALERAEAVAANRAVAGDLYRLAAEAGGTVEIVSRGDSTLRGHVVAEVEAIAAERLAVTGEATDGVLFCPAMLEAGRYTVGDTHFAVVGGVPTPVGHTEFARDPTFGYTSSNLREFLAEVSGGAIAAADVVSLSLDDIRTGGPERVGAILSTVTAGRWVVVNATDYADLDVVALGVQQAMAAGRKLLVRSGPSFVRSLAGIVAKPPLTGADISVSRVGRRHGLIVVGSHVALTSRQLRMLTNCADVEAVELAVPVLLDPGRSGPYLDEVAGRVVAALDRSDVVVFTSRDLVTGGDGTSELAVARTVSAALVRLVRAVRPARPAWIIAKGGITGHDLAARALDIRRAVVVGQFLPGQISLLDPVDAAPDVVGCPYVAFPGNVGADDTLVVVRDRLAAAARKTR